MSSDVSAFASFSPETFTVLAFCESCGHTGQVDRDRVPQGTPTDEILRRLRCTDCGSREATIRIVYTGAGGFHYGAAAPA